MCMCMLHVHVHVHVRGHGVPSWRVRRQASTSLLERSAARVLTARLLLLGTGTYTWSHLGAHVLRASRRVDSCRGAQLDGLVSRGAASVHRDDVRLWQGVRMRSPSVPNFASAGPWAALPLVQSASRSLEPEAPAPEGQGSELWPQLVVSVLVCGAVRLRHHDTR